MKHRAFTATGLGLACLSLTAMSCEPHEVQQAVQYLSVDRWPTEIQRYPHRSHPDHELQYSCPGSTLTVRNTDTFGFEVFANYGPHQVPLVTADPATQRPPVLQPGQEVTIDLSPATGEDALVFVNLGLTARLNDVHC